MEHLNGNIIAVVDIETTGAVAGEHDIIDICVLPLDRLYKPTTIPFNVQMIPMRKENWDYEALRAQRKHLDQDIKDKICYNKEKVLQHILKGLDPWRAADLFVEWFEGLGLAPFKRIMPVAHNWVFDRSFIIEWIGQKSFDYIFDPRYRDTMCNSLYENNIAAWRSEPFPYPKNNLAFLCSQMQIERERAHGALEDCIATAKVLEHMITRHY